MKFVLFLFMVVLCAAAPRQKRLTVGTISVSSPSAAGNVGCVVTGNELYINGLKMRELTSEEQDELSEYQNNFDEYKKAVKDVITEKQKALEARMEGKKASSVGSVKKEDLPEPPTKPSFCTAEDTTQYIFDGCMVQGNKVYVGREYARDLTESEIEQLQQFDKEQTVYQKYVQEQVQQQVQNIFGSSNLFASLFKDGPAEPQETTTRASTQLSTEAPPKAPEVPNFCTAIY